MSLNQWFHSNTGLPVNKWSHYIPVYERYFQAFVGRRINFLEIGAGQGGSSRMWAQLFGPTASIVSIDIREECRAFETDQVSIRIGDQSDQIFLQSLIDEFGAFDIILDDGSHVMSHVNATFDFMYPRMQRDAIYMVEDMHTSYLADWGGGLRRPGTFFEKVKLLIDEIHAHYTKGELPESEFGKITRAIHIYDSIVVFEKGPFLVKKPLSIPFIEDQTIW